jgi:hypothetical protein
MSPEEYRGAGGEALADALGFDGWQELRRDPGLDPRPVEEGGAP